MEVDSLEEICTKIEPILDEMLLKYNSTGIQIQPCLMGLTADKREYRGIFIDGELKNVVSTWFLVAAEELKYAHCPVVDQSMKEDRGKLMITDHQLPTDDEILSGVPFSRIKEVS